MLIGIAIALIRDGMVYSFGSAVVFVLFLIILADIMLSLAMPGVLIGALKPLIRYKVPRPMMLILLAGLTAAVLFLPNSLLLANPLPVLVTMLALSVVTGILGFGSCGILGLLPSIIIVAQCVMEIL